MPLKPKCGQNPLEGLHPSSRVSDWVGWGGLGVGGEGGEVLEYSPRICISNQLKVVLMLMVPGSYFENHWFNERLKLYCLLCT